MRFPRRNQVSSVHNFKKNIVFISLCAEVRCRIEEDRLSVLHDLLLSVHVQPAKQSPLVHKYSVNWATEKLIGRKHFHHSVDVTLEAEIAFTSTKLELHLSQVLRHRVPATDTRPL